MTETTTLAKMPTITDCVKYATLLSRQIKLLVEVHGFLSLHCNASFVLCLVPTTTIPWILLFNVRRENGIIMMPLLMTIGNVKRPSEGPFYGRAQFDSNTFSQFVTNCIKFLR